MPSTNSPQRIPVRDEPPGPELVQRVREALARGGIVGMPTETVYGLAIRADRPSALERLAQLKGSDPGRPWTWHVGSRAATEFGGLRPLVARLTGRYWPGPLTLILRGAPAGLEHLAHEGWTGVRMPAQLCTAGILDALELPVVMTSANLSGQPPALDADAVLGSFGERLALVLDGGPSRLGEPSQLLRVGPGSFELLREGLLPLTDLRRTAGLSLLFVCTGNTCRSPMAVTLARKELERRLGSPEPEAFGFGARSAGVFAAVGAPASENAVTAMSRRGLDLSTHVSTLAAGRLLATADRIYCLTHGHLDALASRAEDHLQDKLELLDPAGRDVPDPIGGTLADYEACAERIAEAIRARASDWA